MDLLCNTHMYEWFYNAAHRQMHLFTLIMILLEIYLWLQISYTYS